MLLSLLSDSPWVQALAVICLTLVALCAIAKAKGPKS